jgi:glutathione S-transferase
VSEEVDFQPANPHGLLLYDFGASPCARRCRIAMIEKGLCWDTETIDLSRLEQRTPVYLEINPNGFVPTLAHGERVIYESNVITEYLDDVFPEIPLYPSDLWELAQVKMWQSAEAAMAKDYRTLMYQRVMGPMLRLTRSLEEALATARRSTSDPPDLAWEARVWRLAVLTPAEESECQDRLLRWLDALEQRLEDRDYLVGDGLSQAEISIYPRVAMFPYIGLRIDPRRYPSISRWTQHLRKRPSFAGTLSEQDRGLTRLSRTPLLPWLGRTLRKAEGERTRWEALRLAILKRAAKRFLGGEKAASDAAPAPSRRIRRPCTGKIAPREAPSRLFGKAVAGEIDPQITLYDYPHSPHGRRIRILLSEKGLPWKTVRVDMGRMAHKAPEFLAINPNGELPALRHGDRLIHDSQLIAEYLDASYEGTKLYPRGAYQVAQARMWLALEAGTHKEFRPLFYLHILRPAGLADGITIENVDQVVPPGVHPSHVKWLRDALRGEVRFDTSEALAREIILSKLEVIERRLAGSAYLVGDSFGMADLGWFTRIETFPALGLEIEEQRFPCVVRWLEAIRRRPAVEANPCAPAPVIHP